MKMKARASEGFTIKISSKGLKRKMTEEELKLMISNRKTAHVHVNKKKYNRKRKGQEFKNYENSMTFLFCA